MFTIMKSILGYYDRNNVALTVYDIIVKLFNSRDVSKLKHNIYIQIILDFQTFNF